MSILLLLKAILYGLLQGVTEWLPVSSTGHLILLEQTLDFQLSDSFIELFRVIVQFGSILAVLCLFHKRLNPFGRLNKDERSVRLRLWKRILIAVLPAALTGFLLNDWIDRIFFNPFIVAVMLITLGMVFLLVERRKTPSIVFSAEDVSGMQAFKIGLWQTLSLVPGTSRSGASILGGLLAGVSRPAAAEFSFFLAVPILFGASLLKIVKSVLNGISFSSEESVVLAVGVVSAFLISIFTVRFLIDYVRRHSLSVFGWYRIVLGVVVLAVSIFK